MLSKLINAIYNFNGRFLNLVLKIFLNIGDFKIILILKLILYLVLSILKNSLGPMSYITTNSFAGFVKVVLLI